MFFNKTFFPVVTFSGSKAVWSNAKLASPFRRGVIQLNFDSDIHGLTSGAVRRIEISTGMPHARVCKRNFAVFYFDGTLEPQRVSAIPSCPVQQSMPTHGIWNM